LFGLVGSPPPEYFADELRREVKSKGGDGMRNVTYEAQFGCFDLVIGTCTGGLVAPRTSKVSGEVVKLKAAPIPGKPIAGMEQAPLDPRLAQKF
jgi:hypothetical protein